MPRSIYEGARDMARQIAISKLLTDFFNEIGHQHPKSDVRVMSACVSTPDISVRCTS